MIEPHCLTNGADAALASVSGRFRRRAKTASSGAKMVSSEPVEPGLRRYRS
jgi:hypothetical protein